MTISYNWISEYIKNKLPKPEKLADLLTMHSFEVQNIEKRDNNYVFNIDILPNRAHDCLSHIGVAKECSALLNNKLQIPKSKLKEDRKLKTDDFINVEVKDKNACPRYTARVITDIKVGPSPKWIQERLKTIGQKPINNIVDATNYVMFEMGQPIHAFDLDKISSVKSQIPSPKSQTNPKSQIPNPKTIFIRRAKKGESITTLDNEICKLDEDILIIADAKSPLALAGVKGGKKAEITSQTKTIVLESANFDIQAVRATQRKTGIKTESSLRFEHELDPNLTNKAIDRVVGIIQEISGGKILKGMIDIYPKKVFPLKIRLDFKKIETILGIKISKQKVIRYLKALGFDVDSSLKVTVPTIRRDIQIEEDLIEEIGRLIGYDKIPATAPLGLIGISRLDEVLIIINKIKNIFEASGFTEVYNFSFVGEDDLNRLGIDKSTYIELENPLSLELKYLRKDLLINLLKNVKDNFKNFGEQGIKIFELGDIYRHSQFKVGPLRQELRQSRESSTKSGSRVIGPWADRIKEEKMLTGLIVSRDEKTRGEKFYELKGIIDNLFNKLGITDYWYDDFQATPEWTDKTFWQKGSTAEIKVGDEEVGFIGEINSEILAKMNINPSPLAKGDRIKGVIAAFDLNFDRIFKLAQEELIYQPPSFYPAAIRDLAVLVNQEDKVADVLNVIEIEGGELVRDVDLFDMYEGEEIPDGKKNLAFHIIYQSDERTLRDEEINKIQKKIVKELEKRGWEVRK